PVGTQQRQSGTPYPGAPQDRPCRPDRKSKRGKCINQERRRNAVFRCNDEPGLSATQEITQFPLRQAVAVGRRRVEMANAQVGSLREEVLPVLATKIVQARGTKPESRGREPGLKSDSRYHLALRYGLDVR